MGAVRLSCVLHSEYDTAIRQRDEARARVAELEEYDLIIGANQPSQERATGAVGSAPANAALRQRVFEHLGNLILNEKASWGGLPDLVAQFDLLGRDL